MKIKANRLEECSTLFEIDVPKATIDEAFGEVYAEISKVASIPGFRVGKAPADLVKKHYGSSARDEVLKRLIPKAYKTALAEHKIAPIGLPEIMDVSFEDGKALSFKARVDMHPKFNIKDYKGIKIEKKKALIKDEDVEKTIQDLREINAKYIPADDRPVQLGDYVSGDVEGFVEGKPIHKKRENIWLHIDKESFVPGLNEKMVGMKKGEERDIEVVLPAPLNQTKDNLQRGPAVNSVESGSGGKKYPDKLVTGKPARYHVKVKEIKSRRLPDMDDEFAKDLGRNDLADLKKTVATELEYRMKMNIEVDMENQLLKRLTDDNQFSVPSNLVKRQAHYMAEDAKRRLEDKGFKAEELDKKDGELIEKFKDDAVRQVRLMFILNEIARREDIKVSDADIADTYKSISAQSGESAEAVKEHYEKEDAVDSLIEKIKEEKTIKFLLEKAEIT